MARDWFGEPVSADTGIIAKPAEMAYLLLQGAALIEPRRLPGHWSGRSQGFSIPITNGVRYRVGATKGTFQQGAEVPTAIDQGTVLVSDRRAVFAGPKQSREWLYSKLLGFHHDDSSPWTALAVSNRQKVSGFMYTEATEMTVRFRLELALAQFRGTRDEFAASIDLQVAQLTAAEPARPDQTQPDQTQPDQSQPGPPLATVAGPAAASGLQGEPGQAPAAPAPAAAAAGALPPAGWYANPQAAGRRYWDGARWTSYTAP